MGQSGRSQEDVGWLLVVVGVSRWFLAGSCGGGGGEGRRGWAGTMHVSATVSVLRGTRSRSSRPLVRTKTERGGGSGGIYVSLLMLLRCFAGVIFFTKGSIVYSLGEKVGAS